MQYKIGDVVQFTHKEYITERMRIVDVFQDSLVVQIIEGSLVGRATTLDAYEMTIIKKVPNLKAWTEWRRYDR